jgi:tricarballylate dehydrogenase
VSESVRSESVDVIVVGAGSAAMAAALACHEGGAERVVMLEKAPEPEFGGNPRFSHSGFRWAQSGKDEIREFLPQLVDTPLWDTLEFKPYTEEQFADDVNRATRGRMDPVLRDALIGDSNSALHWLLDNGLKWEPEGSVRAEVDGQVHFEPGYTVQPLGGGLGQLYMLREICLARGIELRYESKVARLHGDMYRVEGVGVDSPGGSYDLFAPATILCAGGFQASRAARARYLTVNADLMKVRGSRHNTGEVLEMAVALGASTAGQWQLGHSSVVDANSPDYELLHSKYNRYSYMYGIMVNSLGERYVDEGSNFRMLTYARLGWVTLAQPEGTCYQIFDQKIVAQDGEGNRVFRESYRHAPEVFEADTIAELARKMQIDPVRLARTVEQFNDSSPDDIPFRPDTRDGKATVGLELPKSNWANRIDKPPFVAYPITAGITFTFGGLEINADAQVLNTGARPIAGLYASGDIVGLFYNGYVGSTGQTRNVVFSRRAARHATG